MKLMLENLLEDIESGTEEAVTEVEMEDVTMTTPITTPAAKEVTNKVIFTTSAPVVDIDKEESLNEEQDLEMNQESISQEKIPMKLRIDLIKMTLVLRQKQTTMDGSTSPTVIQGLCHCTKLSKNSPIHHQNIYILILTFLNSNGHILINGLLNRPLRA